MAIKLHRCSATIVRGRHPCWVAQKALDDAGISYELVRHSALRPRRGDVERLSGARRLPLAELGDGTIVRESRVIAERARNGTLTSPGATDDTA